MQKQYTLTEGQAYDTSLLQAHLNTELDFETGISSAGAQGFIVYFDSEDQIPEVDSDSRGRCGSSILSFRPCPHSH